MCEPHQSIVQFNDDDYNNGQGGKPCHWAGRIAGAIKQYGKQIGRFFHITQFGSGHSRIMAEKKITTVASFSLHSNLDPPHVKWEMLWPQRKMVFDSAIITNPDDLSVYNSCLSNCYTLYSARTKIADLEDRRLKARKYSEDTATGTMGKLRQFLNLSIRKSGEPEKYVVNFFEMLTKSGIVSLEKKIIAITGMKKDFSMFERFSWKLKKHLKDKRTLESVIKVILGYTRRRNFLTPEWADDTKLWK